MIANKTPESQETPQPKRSLSIGPNADRSRAGDRFYLTTDRGGPLSRMIASGIDGEGNELVHLSYHALPSSMRVIRFKDRLRRAIDRDADIDAGLNDNEEADNE